jgi:hypothetical protein
MEASPEQSAEGSAIVGVLATVLDRLVCANAPIARDDPGQVTKFHAMKAPGIGIRQYLERYVSWVGLLALPVLWPFSLTFVTFYLNKAFKSTRRAQTSASFSLSSTLIG